MSLIHLGDFASATLKKIESLSFKDIILPEEFKIQYQQFIQKNTPGGFQSIDWSQYTARVTTSTTKLIYLSNFWFFIASQLAHLIDALEKHRNVFLEIFDNEEDDKNAIAKSLRDKDEQSILHLGRINDYFLSRKFSPQEKVNFILFVTDYGHWGGGKTIDRGDYYVSPLMRAGNLLAETQSAIAEIAMQFAKHQNLWILIDKDVININTKKAIAISSRQNIESLLMPLQEAIQNAGLSFSNIHLARLIAAQITKPFVILAGLSGSGKTKIAETVAFWLSADPESQICIVAVGADWTNNEPLLGYANAISPSEYVAPPSGILHLLKNAIENSDVPHFLILDEMNLSHVERYFADFLSAMESSNPELALHGQGTLKADGLDVPSRMALPPNLFIIGTVNVDETTYMFSPKVLDRANVIEFRVTADQMSHYLSSPTKTINLQALEGKGAYYAKPFVTRANQDAVLEQTDLLRLNENLMEIFEPLAEVGAEFGYRTAKEISRFIAIHKELSGEEWEYTEALDAQVMQKLMPKLHGSARKLSGVLDALENFAEKHNLSSTKDKVGRMKKRLKDQGFTSFAEN